MNYFVTFFFLLLVGLRAEAHIGSPDILYEGNAGPYPVLITIQPPDVVPGIARIFIDTGKEKIGRITLQPIYYQYGSEGAPKGDVAKRISSNPQLYEGSLWLMTFGSSSVKVSIEGPKGLGSTIVPVPALATATRNMDQTTSTGLKIMGVFLTLSLVSIIGAAIRESTLPHGAKPSAKRKRSAIVVMTFTFTGVVLLLVVATFWWRDVENEYRKNMFRPLSLSSSIKKEGGQSILQLTLGNPAWLDRKIDDLIEDHGKLMHLFLINPEGLEFAHLHPAPHDSMVFTSKLPDLDQGTYLLFAEVVHSNGMAETLTDTLYIQEKIGTSLSDPEEYAGNVPLSSGTAILDNLKIKATNPENYVAGLPVKLSFKCTEDSGEPARLQPYLGMAGHAVVMKDDGSVFIHLHPMGTISMASQYALAGKIDDNVTICGGLSDSTITNLETTGIIDKQTMSLMRSKNSYTPDILFPYVFPKPGDYYVWIQVKHHNRIKCSKFKIRAL